MAISVGWDVSHQQAPVLATSLNSSLPPVTRPAPNAAKSHLPIDYHRWSPRTALAPGTLAPDVIFDPYTDGYEINLPSRRYVVGPLKVADQQCKSGEIPRSIMLFAYWLQFMDDNALELRYTFKEWQIKVTSQWQHILRQCQDDHAPVHSPWLLLGFDLEETAAEMGRGQAILPVHRSTYGCLPAVQSARGRQEHKSALDKGVFMRAPNMYPLRSNAPSSASYGERVTMSFAANPGMTAEESIDALSFELGGLCRLVDLNNKSSDAPMPNGPATTRQVLTTLLEAPIVPHLQATSKRPVTCHRIGGERILTSAKCLNECEPVQIAELKCPKRHTGRLLLCRIISRPQVHADINLLVEDSYGHVIAVTVQYALPRPAITYTPKEIRKLYPVGACFVIKEPYVRFGMRGAPEVRVPWAKDMVGVPLPKALAAPYGLEPSIDSLRAYRLAAATAYHQGKPDLAIRLASLAVNAVDYSERQLRDQEEEVELLELLVGRAMIYAIIDRPGPALSDCLRAEVVLGRITIKVSSWLPRRLAVLKFRAFYNLRLFNMAKSALDSCKQLGIDRPLLESYQAILAQRLNEQKGVYRCQNGTSTPIGLTAGLTANYIGPVKVSNDPIKGRIIVTTRPVAAGELLLWEVPAIKTSATSAAAVTAYKLGEGGRICGEPDLAKSFWAVHSIGDDPSLGVSIAELCPEPNHSTTALGVTDEERLHAFLHPSEFDLDLVERKVQLNAWSDEGALRLQITGSMFSHSCRVNVLTALEKQKNCHMTKAINDVAAGEELYVTYLDPLLGYAERQHRLQEGWGFKCDCTYCTADGHPDEQISTRNKLMKETGTALFKLCTDLWRQIDAAGSAARDFGTRQLQIKTKLAINQLHAFRKQLDGTYAQGRRVKLEESDALLHLGQLYQASDPANALQCFQEGLQYRDWEINTEKQMKKTGKAIRTIGSPWELEEGNCQVILQNIICLCYRLEKTFLADCYARSLVDLRQLTASPIDDSYQISSLSDTNKVDPSAPTVTLPGGLVVGNPHQTVGTDFDPADPRMVEALEMMGAFDPPGQGFGEVARKAIKKVTVNGRKRKVIDIKVLLSNADGVAASDVLRKMKTNMASGMLFG